jgi:hypothetical protein
MGRKLNTVDIYKISLTPNKIGNIEKLKYCAEEQFIKKLNIKGWK